VGKTAFEPPYIRNKQDIATALDVLTISFQEKPGDDIITVTV
jgi:hypothetical protein